MCFRQRVSPPPNLRDRHLSCQDCPLIADHSEHMLKRRVSCPVSKKMRDDEIARLGGEHKRGRLQKENKSAMPVFATDLRWVKFLVCSDRWMVQGSNQLPKKDNAARYSNNCIPNLLGPLTLEARGWASGIGAAGPAVTFRVPRSQRP